MAMVKFIGRVRSYSVGDDNLIHLGIDDETLSENARFYVQDLIRHFNPQSGNHGFGAKDTPCTIRPGFASYRFSASPDKVNNVLHDSRVEVEMEIYHVRRVKFYNRRWAAIPDLRYELVNIRVLSEAKVERPAKTS